MLIKEDDEEAVAGGGPLEEEDPWRDLESETVTRTAAPVLRPDRSSQDPGRRSRVLTTEPRAALRLELRADGARAMAATLALSSL